MQLFKTVGNMLRMSVHFAFKAAKGIFALALLNGNAWERHSFTVTRIRGFGESKRRLNQDRLQHEREDTFPNLVDRESLGESLKFDSSHMVFSW